MSKNTYTTDINELKVKDFFVLQKALLTLTIGENFNDLESIIIKSLSLLAKNKVADAHHELVSILTVIKNSESSVVDGLNALLKNGDISNTSYKDLLKEFEEVKKKSLIN